MNLMHERDTVLSSMVASSHLCLFKSSTIKMQPLSYSGRVSLVADDDPAGLRGYTSVTTAGSLGRCGEREAFF